MEKITKQDVIDAFIKYMPDIEEITAEKVEELSELGITREFLITKLLESSLASMIQERQLGC